MFQGGGEEAGKAIVGTETCIIIAFGSAGIFGGRLLALPPFRLSGIAV